MLGVLVDQEADDRLGDRQADGAGVGFIAHDVRSSLVVVGAVRRSAGHGQAGVDLLVLPGAADPVVGGVVGGEPGQVLVGPGHDIEVVHVVAGGGHAGAVVAVGHERDVAVAHLRAQVDRPAGIGGVGAVQAEAGPAGGRGGDLEVNPW